MSAQQPSTRPDDTLRTTPAPVVRDPAQRLPQIWDDTRDTAFFSLTARLFPPAVTLGMTVLLASHDDPAPDGSTGRG